MNTKIYFYSGNSKRITSDLISQTQYAIEFKTQPDTKQLQILQVLLELTDKLEIKDKQSFQVWPRLGSQSPWSSKALDIIASCGLDCIHRIEKGSLYIAAKDRLAAEDIGSYYDKMTEQLLTFESEYQFDGFAEQEFVKTLDNSSFAQLQQANANYGYSYIARRISVFK